jgi:hypothetical protein
VKKALHEMLQISWETEFGGRKILKYRNSSDYKNNKVKGKCEVVPVL